MVQTNDTEIISMGVDYLTVICVFGYFGLPEMGTKGAKNSYRSRTDYSNVIRIIF